MLNFERIIEKYGSIDQFPSADSHLTFWRRLKLYELILQNPNDISISILYQNTYGMDAPNVLLDAYKKYIENQISSLLETDEIKEMLN